MVEKRPIIFGEVLFDCFDDGQCVLGGAPFNVAWHLQGFGLQPLFVSRIGQDARADEVLAAMQKWGLDSQGMQQDEQHPTGVVSIQLQQGQPEFTILEDQAYDFIDFAAMKSWLSNGKFCLLYHGTLIARNEVSATALNQLSQALPVPRFVDINLRAPWWSFQSLAQAIAQAAWIKLNEKELPFLLEAMGLPSSTIDDPSSIDAQIPSIESVMQQNNSEHVMVTHGAQGAHFVTREGHTFGQPVAVENIMDTVGAGDAFSAVCIAGILYDWSTEDTLARALAFAAEICKVRGATPFDVTLYENTKAAWGL